MKQNTLKMAYLQKTGWHHTEISDFDIHNPIEADLGGKFWFLNAYSKMILEILEWPKTFILFIFSNQDEASKCLKIIFPKALTISNDISGLKIRVHIMSDVENKIDLISERICQKGFSDFPYRETVWSQLREDWVLNGTESDLPCSKNNQQEIITTKETTSETTKETTSETK